MMKRFILALALLLGLTASSLATPVYAAGSDVLNNACNSVGGSGKSDACNSKSSETISGTGGVLYRVTRLIAVIAGVTAVIVMIAAGLIFITSNGDASKAANARNTILYAAIGLVVIVLAQSIITLVINRVG